ncbi:MAG: RNase P modulator RnpM [Candidatus Zhuqueibacterota bacterium]
MAQPNWHRVCVGCRQARHKSELLRIVKTKTGQFEIDENQDKPGRGAYVCPRRACVQMAEKKRGFNASFRCEVPRSLYREIYQWINLLEQ